MKNRRGMAAAVLFLASAALGVGFFLPDLVGRAADRKMGSEAETFAIDKVPSAADARLVDMLRLADTYENEVYLDSGAVRDESDMRIIAADLINRLSGCGVLDKIECEDFSLSPFIAVKGKMFSDDAYGYDEVFCQFVHIRVYVVTKIKKFRQNPSLSELFQLLRIYSAVVSVASGFG